jgi:protein MpaA
MHMTQSGTNSKWSNSAGGLDIALHWRISEKSVAKNQQPILFIGGVHGDEPEGVELAKQTLQWLRLQESQAKIQNLNSWFLIECLNPDGYFSTPSQRMNSNGVDLNRNFPVKDWSAESKGPRYFPGRHPASEPEVQSLVQLIDQINPRVIIHCHSDSVACNVFTGEPGRLWASILEKHSGYPAKPDIGYPTPGSLGQYGWHHKQIPVVCIEELEKIDLKTVWPRFEKAIEELFYNL